MSDYGTVLDQGSVRFERLLPGPIERVWEYLTQSDKRATWLAAGPMELRVGGRVELVFRNEELAGPDEETPAVYKDASGHRQVTRITRIEPPRLLAFTWGNEVAGPGEPPPSEVVFELEPRDGQVLLVLTHRRLSRREDAVSVSSGWHVHLAVLASVLGGGARPRFWAEVLRLEQEYERRIPR